MSAVKIVFVELHAWAWVGILLARLAVGSAFFLSGRRKLFVIERRDQMRQTLSEAHIPFPELNAVLEHVCVDLTVSLRLQPPLLNIFDFWISDCGIPFIKTFSTLYPRMNSIWHSAKRSMTKTNLQIINQYFGLDRARLVRVFPALNRLDSKGAYELSPVV